MASDQMQLDLDQLRDCFAEANRERDQLEESIERSLENIQALQQRLCQWHTELRDSTDELENQRDRIAREAERATQQDQARAAEIARLERELVETRQAVTEHAVTDEQIEKLNLQQKEEVRRLREECEKLETLRLNTETELEAERRNSNDLRAALESAHEGVAKELEQRLQKINEELAQTKGNLDERTVAIRNLEQERTALETELEMVRTRAAELTEALDQERKQMAQDRAEWSSELKQLRRLLERQARLATNPVAPGERPVQRANEGDSEPAGNGVQAPRRNDPVVGSVLAQFDRIRQQRLASRASS
jgi:chromosome segregation ATPase